MKALWQWTQDMRVVGGEGLPGAHARLADLVMDLVRVTGELVGDDEAQRQLGQFGGVQRTASVVAARERLASAQVVAMTREMKTLADSPHASGVIDEREFVKQLEELRPLTGELERAVFEFVSAAEEKAHHEQMDALTTAARQVPGVSLRVTEDVIGPDGSSVKSVEVVYEVDPSVGRVGQAVMAGSSGSSTSSTMVRSTAWARAMTSSPR